MRDLTDVGAALVPAPTREVDIKINQLISCGRDDSNFQKTVASILLYLLQKEKFRDD